MTGTDNDSGGRRSRRRWIVKVSVVLACLAVLAVTPLLFIEYRAWSAHATTLDRLKQALKHATQLDEKGQLQPDHALTLPVAKLLLVGDPVRHTRKTYNWRWEIFEWSGITDHYFIALRVGLESGNVWVVKNLLKLPAAKTYLADFDLPSAESQVAKPALVKKVKRLLAGSARSFFPQPHRTANLIPQQKLQLSWYRAAHGEAYDKFGSKNPAWDENVLRFLDGYAQRLAKDRDAPTAEELITLGRAIDEAGCPDPLVLSVYAKLLAQTGQTRWVIPIVRRVESARASKYPPRWQLSTRLRSLYSLPRMDRVNEDRVDVDYAQSARNAAQSSLRGEVVKRTIDQIAQTVATEQLDNAGRRLHLMQILEFTDSHPSNDVNHVPQQLGTVLLQQQSGDKWLRLMTLADIHLSLGWLTPGNGLWIGLGTSRKGKQVFHAHLRRARALLLEAWELNPALPEAAAGMIKVTTIIDGVANDSTRFWFEQAVEADYTDSRTYALYRSSLNPRSLFMSDLPGADTEQLLAFGRECLSGNRFDTNVPWEFHQAVVAAASGSRDARRSVYQTPQVYDDYRKLFHGYIKSETPQRQAAHESYLACIAFKFGRFDEARRLLTALGKKVNPVAFAELGESLVNVREFLDPAAVESMPFGNHEGQLNGVAVVANGLLVTVNSDDTEKVWDRKTARDFGNMLEHLQALTTITAAPGRELIATGDSEGRVVVWNAKLRRELHTLQIVPPVHAIAFSPNGRLLATGGGDGHVRLWDPDDGRLAATLAARGKSVGSLSFSSTGRLLASTSAPNSSLESSTGWNTGWETREVALWDLDSLKLDRQFAIFQTVAALAVFSSDGKSLAVAGWDLRRSEGSVKVVDAGTGKTISTCRDTFSRVHQMLFSPDDQRLYVASADGNVQIVSSRTGEVQATFRGHSSAVRSIALTSDAKTLISADENGVIREWNVASDSLRSQTISPPRKHRIGRLIADGMKHGKGWLATCEKTGVTLWNRSDDYHSGFGLDGMGAGKQATAFDLSADKDLIAVATNDSDTNAGAEVVLWNTQTGRLMQRFKASSRGWIKSVQFSPDRWSLLFCGHDDRITIWNMASTTPRRTATYSLEPRRLGAFGISSNGRYLAAGTTDGQVVVWDLSGGGSAATKFLELQPPDTLHRDGIVAVRWLPESSRFATCTNSSVDIWDVSLRKSVAVFTGGVVAISADGRRIAAAGGKILKNDAHLWDASSGDLLHHLRGGHTQAIIAGTWSPDSRFFFSASVDGVIRRWDAETGQVVLNKP